MNTFQLFSINERFDALSERIGGCRLCPEMDGCTRVLSWANGNPSADIMFVGEAPGRLGADRTAIPFHGDKAGDNFEKLLDLAGLSRAEIFVTNAVLCNPKDDKGNNAPPTNRNLKNCSANLKAQVDLLQPKVVVTLGAAALKCTELVSPHGLRLSEAVRTSNEWYGRKLIPLYHPGARAMIHRNFAAQAADYYFVREIFRRRFNTSTKRRAQRVSPHQNPSWDIVKYVVMQMSQLSLFSLHKILFLVDLQSRKVAGRNLTSFYYIRQKDGPYCVELGGGWHRAFPEQIGIRKSGGKLNLVWLGEHLFTPPPEIQSDAKAIVDEVLEKVRDLDDSRLKTRVYLTEPMKAILQAERRGLSQLNRPLF